MMLSAITVQASDFAGSPAGYFLSLGVAALIPIVLVGFQRMGAHAERARAETRKTLEDQNMEMKQFAVVQSQHSSALSMVLLTLNPNGGPPLATTMAIVAAKLEAHLVHADQDRGVISQQIADLRQTQFDKPATPAPAAHA